MFEPDWEKLFMMLVFFGLIAVGGWFFIRSAVTSGVRAAARRDGRAERRQEMLEWEAEQRGERR